MSNQLLSFSSLFSRVNRDPMKPEPRQRRHRKARSAGTGVEDCRNVRLSQEMEEAAATVQEEVTAGYEKAERALELLRHEGENEAEELVAE